MSSFVDGRPSERRRLSPALWSSAPVGLQIATSLTISFAIAGAAWLSVPEAVIMVTQFFGTGIHEVGHLVGALLQNGDIYEVAVTRQGGHAQVSAPDGVATAVSGLLMVPFLAMMALVCGLCRWGVQVWLAAFGLTAIILGLLTNDLVVRWTLLPWGALVCIAAILPIYEALRAAFLLVVGFVLVKATVDGLPYLSRPEITLPSGQAVLSDTGLIADLLGHELLDVRDMLVLVMLAFVFTGACLVGRFLFVHRRVQ